MQPRAQALGRSTKWRSPERGERNGTQPRRATFHSWCPPNLTKLPNCSTAPNALRKFLILWPAETAAPSSAGNVARRWKPQKTWAWD